MTFEEAEALAEKREAHKSKHMANKMWAPVHDSVKGWHVALVNNPAHILLEKRAKAFQALQDGDMKAFTDAAGEALLAHCQIAIGKVKP